MTASPAIRSLGLALLLVAGTLSPSAAAIALGTTRPAGSLAAPSCDGRPATIMGTAGDDRIHGTRRDDVIIGRGGNDVIVGRGGDDRICGGSGDDLVRGGPGEDVVYGEDGRDVIHGGAGADRLNGGPSRDIVHGGVGDDVLWGDRQDDLLYGMSGEDELLGGPGDDTLDGGDDDDHLEGHAGRDAIMGRTGDDRLFGMDGADRLFGNAGADELRGGDGSDRLDGGAGRDACLQGGGSGSPIRCENAYADLAIAALDCPPAATLDVPFACQVMIINQGPEPAHHVVERTHMRCDSGSCGVHAACQTGYILIHPVAGTLLAAGAERTDAIEVTITRWACDGFTPDSIEIRVRPTDIFDAIDPESRNNGARTTISRS